jgi:hypothetical protein
VRVRVFSFRERVSRTIDPLNATRSGWGFKRSAIINLGSMHSDGEGLLIRAFIGHRGVILPLVYAGLRTHNI